ncbi:unnamed protein product [Lasius platythorax]|uniref:Uncharacterized protein n=1 Tax=Lasius platythorax TaxID=488582 RepID=A0AAV2NCD5_9HYME
MASTNKEPDNEGWSGRSVGNGQCLRSTSPVPAEWSVFYKAIRRTWRRNGPLPVGVRSIYRYLAECLSA